MRDHSAARGVLHYNPELWGQAQHRMGTHSCICIFDLGPRWFCSFTLPLFQAHYLSLMLALSSTREPSHTRLAAFLRQPGVNAKFYTQSNFSMEIFFGVNAPKTYCEVIGTSCVCPGSVKQSFCDLTIWMMECKGNQWLAGRKFRWWIYVIKCFLTWLLFWICHNAPRCWSAMFELALKGNMKGQTNWSFLRSKQNRSDTHWNCEEAVCSASCCW